MPFRFHFTHAVSSILKKVQNYKNNPKTCTCSQKCRSFIVLSYTVMLQEYVYAINSANIVDQMQYQRVEVYICFWFKMYMC